MSITVKLKILGDPMGKQRPKATSINGFVRTYTPKETVNYESMVVNVIKTTKNQFVKKDRHRQVVKLNKQIETLRRELKL